VTRKIVKFEFKDKNAKQQHFGAVYSEEAQKYAGDICPKSSSRQSSLRYHLKKHTDQTIMYRIHVTSVESSLQRRNLRKDIKLGVHNTESEILHRVWHRI